MSVLKFTWKGVSSDTYGIEVTSLPPETLWMKRDEAIQVPARDGELHIQDGAIEGTTWQIQIYLPASQASQLAAIKSWLRGSGVLTLSDRPGRSYRAMIIDEISFTAWVQGYADRTAAIYFTVEPYAYHTDSPTGQSITGATGTITNPGTAMSKPLIKLVGSGDLTVAISGQVFEVEGIDGYIEIDSEYLTVTKGAALRYSKFSGEFPVLVPGANVYSVSGDGTFTRMELTPRWRDI